jgi:hypothetical protein
MVPQQTGVPPIIRQQVQPAFRQAVMQSQQPWIMAMQAGSPLVQVTTQPSLVISVLHMPIIRLQLQQTMPFIMAQHEHMPPASMVHRFCIMALATASSHEQVIFMPPDIRSTVILQRGTIIMLGAMAAVPMAGIPDMLGMPMPGIPIPVRSIIIVLVMFPTPWLTTSADEKFAGRAGARPPSQHKKPAKSLARPCPPGKLC